MTQTVKLEEFPYPILSWIDGFKSMVSNGGVQIQTKQSDNFGLFWGATE